MGFFSNLFGFENDDDIGDIDTDSGLELDELQDDPLEKGGLNQPGNSPGQQNMDPQGQMNQGMNNQGMGPNNFDTGDDDPFNNDFQDPFQKGKQTGQNQQDYQYSQNQSGKQPTGDVEKDIKIMIEKLDAVKSSVNSLHHRLDKLEKEKDKMWK